MTITAVKIKYTEVLPSLVVDSMVSFVMKKAGIVTNTFAQITFIHMDALKVAKTKIYQTLR